MEKTNPAFIFGAFVIVLVVGFVAYRGLNLDKPVPSSVSPTPVVEGVENVQGMDASQSIEVEGGMFYFKPNEIKVKVGEKVTITFKSVEGVHDFVIDELNLKTKQIKAGGSETVEFTPDKPGIYEFYCSVANHRAMGMKGTLIIE